MAEPSWTDEKFGTMKRAALWLVQVVGEGNTFTKEDTRDAFPGISQADRRVRDLRDHGWRIDTNREDVTLGPNEQRFVQQGAPVWEPGKATKASVSINQTRRREVLAADGAFCRSCGITPGETFAGSWEAAQLDIARRVVVQPDGSEKVQLITECNWCRVGGRKTSLDLSEAMSSIAGLGTMERKVLAEWVTADRREFSPVEKAWAAYRALPEESRAQIRSLLLDKPAH